MLPRRHRFVSAIAPVIGAVLALTAPAPAQAATRTVDVAYNAGASTMQRLLDRCDGPVVVKFDGIRPRLLAEHDYCGGRWILALERGDIVRVEGGNIGGRYRVGPSKVVRKGTSASALLGMGAVVAQTCRPDGDTLRLVGLTRVD